MILRGLICSVSVVVLMGSPAVAMTVDKFFTVNPIQVCDDAGMNCANTPLFQAEMEKIYLQAGVAPIILPTQQLNSSTLLNAPSVTSFGFAGNGRHTNAQVLNVWFVNTMPVPMGTLFGNAYVGGNGAAINSSAVDAFNGGNGRRDTVAHELGHNHGLGHSDFGAGGANNVMTTGNVRSVPDGVGNITPDGAGLGVLTMDQIDEIRDNSPFIDMAPVVTVDTFGSTPFQTDDFFEVAFNMGPVDTYLESLTLDLTPVNAFFDATNDPPGLGGSGFQTSNLSGIAAGEISTASDAALNGQQQLTIDFDPMAFMVGDSFSFGIDVDLFSNIDGFGAEPTQLIGATYSFQFSNGFSTMVAMDASLVASSTTNVTGIMQPTGMPMIPAMSPVMIPDPDPTMISDPNPTVDVSEPATLAPLGAALVGFVALRRRRR